MSLAACCGMIASLGGGVAACLVCSAGAAGCAGWACELVSLDVLGAGIGAAGCAGWSAAGAGGVAGGCVVVLFCAKTAPDASETTAAVVNRRCLNISCLLGLSGKGRPIRVPLLKGFECPWLPAKDGRGRLTQLCHKP